MFSANFIQLDSGGPDIFFSVEGCPFNTRNEVPNLFAKFFYYVSHAIFTFFFSIQINTVLKQIFTVSEIKVTFHLELLF